MMMLSILSEVLDYTSQIGLLEFAGLLFGLICVLLLIKENIWTWPAGIAYVLISFYVFWNAQLYGDFILHIIFLVLNIYGWYEWLKKPDSTKDKISITALQRSDIMKYIGISVIGIILFSRFLAWLPSMFEGMPPAALPFWDSTTSVLSVTGIWLQAKKKIDNWYYWFAVDVLATGIYFYKGIYFYSLLYFIYIFLAVAGYREWRKKLSPSTI